ncbi:MAG: T9SS type A sorting domain-containing protein [Saprospiraceae bacterium]
MKNLTSVQSQNRTVLQLLLSLLLCCGASHLTAQCSNDNTPPVPVCTNPLQKQVQLYEPTIIQAAEFNAGSTDDCTAAAALKFFVELGNTPSPAPPPITSIQYPEGQTGQHPVILWVVDSAGNAANCATTLDLTPCTNSTPAITCNDHVIVQLGVNGTALITPGMMLEGGPYCPDYEYQMRFPPAGQYASSITVGTADIGTRIMQITNFQNGSPFNSCWGNVTVSGGCNPDITPPTVVCEANTVVAIDTSLYEQFVLWPDMLDQGSFDNCTAAGNLTYLLGLTSPAGQFFDSLLLQSLGTYNVILQVTDEAGNLNYCWTEVTVNHKSAHLIQGAVFHDENGDCDRQPGSEPGLAGWPVRAVAQSTGAVYLGTTDSAGHYTIKVPLPLAAFDVAVAVPFNYGGGICPTTYIATFTKPTKSEAFVQDLPVILSYECALLYVDLATPRIRPCFPGIYHVQYVNLSGQTVTGTYVDVTLDDALAFVSSSIPETDLGNQVYRFQTGDLAPGAGGRFSINFFTDCDTEAGATHCTEAHIFPDTTCANNPAWSGADVAVQAICANDSVRLSIKNIGTGPNAGPLNYIVVEDVLMRNSNTFQLNAGQTMLLDPFPATGATIRLQAQQEPGHPYGGVQAVALEGCGGFTPGMVTLFPLSPADPFVALDCRQNVSSFDPNDKQALPLGYGAQHFVEKNTDLDYTIRFQNTGTDTAYTVVLLDTLSQFLAARQIRPGVSSHAYRFELLEGRIAKFVFENILLPDSNANLAASEGFVQFRIPQAPDNPDGTRIENTAAIYFDFNAPVITNTVWHTVGTNFVSSATTYADPNRSPLRVYPNPASTVVHFAAEALPGETMNLSVTDALGREVRSSTAEQMPISLDCSGLPAGTYFFHIRAANARTLWAGTLLVR